MLEEYPQLVSRIQNTLTELGQIDYSLAAVRYDKIPTGETNKIYSDVESYVVNKYDNPYLEEMIKKKLRIDNSLDSLNLKEKEIVRLKYWEGKTFEDLAWHFDRAVKTVRLWRDVVIEKLINAGILLDNIKEKV